ncbi:MAG: MoaD/ThiS family protein [Nitrososphaeria archaeon]|nr:MoaD/ThiS family protein [Nitrososphaeria archaeon]
MKVVFVGHLKRLFGKESIVLEELVEDIRTLIKYLNYLKLDENVIVDRSNTLILVNGVEISALNGLDTKVNEGDVITLIPVTHGG